MPATRRCSVLQRVAASVIDGVNERVADDFKIKDDNNVSKILTLVLKI